ncbi:MAG: DUF1700 domain-containing protein [Eubacteriales bacterium]|nr:DUF1700 domain-containing protein [Eubacteriales bacterium]
MNKSEFLETLRTQLSGQMQEGKAAAHVRYYEEYIETQVRDGQSESEVLSKLGDPRLIAKTLLDTDSEADQQPHAKQQGYSYQEDRGSQSDSVKKRHYKLDLSTWYGKLAVIAIAALVIVLLIFIVGTLLPILIVVSIVLYLISHFRKR